MTGDLLHARSVEELHLFLDLAGWQAERTHRMVEGSDGTLCVVYRGRRADGASVEATVAPVPGLPPDAPSRLIDAAQWYRLACALAKTVPAGPERHQPVCQARLLLATHYLEEVLRFADAGAPSLPRSAFWSPEGRAALAREPARFETAMLQSELRTWRRLLAP